MSQDQVPACPGHRDPEDLAVGHRPDDHYYIVSLREWRRREFADLVIGGIPDQEMAVLEERFDGIAEFLESSD